MKTILLEVDDNSYQTVLAFIKLLPNNRCRVLEDDELSADEHQHIRECITQIQQGNYSEFDDGEVVKKQL
jgi:hypothetical protein